MTTPPPRIYNWLDSQLSIARFAGSISINGVTYVVALAIEAHEEILRHSTPIQMWRALRKVQDSYRAACANKE